MDYPTRGPWHHYFDDNRTRFVVTTAPLDEPGSPRTEMCTLGPDSEANARLIAAAPDLLAALRECVVPTDVGPRFARDPEVLERAMAALSKPPSGATHTTPLTAYRHRRMYDQTQGQKAT